MVNLFFKADREGRSLLRVKGTKPLVVFATLFEKNGFRDNFEDIGAIPDVFNDMFGDMRLQCRLDAPIRLKAGRFRPDSWQSLETRSTGLNQKKKDNVRPESLAQ